MEVPAEDRGQVYDALRQLDLGRLDRYRVQPAEIEEYMRGLQVTIARKQPFDTRSYQEAGREGEPATDARALHREITELVDLALGLCILIRPGDWDARAKYFRKSIMPQIVTHLPASHVRPAATTVYELLSASLSEISEAHSEARLLLAAHLTLHGQHEAALKELGAYSNAHSNDALPYVLAGSVLCQSGQYGAAIQSYQKAYRCGDRATAAFGIAFANLLAGDRRTASEWIDKGTRIAPKCRIGRIVRTLSLRMNGEFKEALQVSEELLSEDESNSYAMAQRAWCLFTLRRYHEGFVQARTLLRSGEGPYRSAYSIMASCLWGANKLRFAERLAERALLVLGDSIEKAPMYRLLRSIALCRKDVRRAVRCAARMCRCAPADPCPRLWLALDLREVAHPLLGRRFATIHVDVEKLSEYTIAEVARAYTCLGNYYRAAELLSVISKPENIEVAAGNLSRRSLLGLYIGLSWLLDMRLQGLERGDWQV
jgi:tetratricopeptide (TPR) repeat protein